MLNTADQPFYHVLVDSRDREGDQSCYVAEENIGVLPCVVRSYAVAVRMRNEHWLTRICLSRARHVCRVRLPRLVRLTPAVSSHVWWQEADDEAVAVKTTECNDFVLWRWASAPGVAPADDGAEGFAEERGRSEPEPEQAAAAAAARQPASTEDDGSSREASSVLWGDLQDTEWVCGTTGPIRNADLGAPSATYHHVISCCVLSLELF